MAIFVAWRKALGTSAIGQTLERTVNPTEAKRLFNNFNVWNTICTGVLGAIRRNPTILGRLVVVNEPLAQFGSGGVFQKISDLHKSIAYF